VLSGAANVRKALFMLRRRRRPGPFGKFYIMLIATTLALLASSQPPVDKPRFTCTVTRVHDGDGPIHCREGVKVRLQAIAAREVDETCSPGHPCPEASGAAAKAALSRLALGRTLECEPTGKSYGRITAWCSTTAGTDLSCAMVRSGTALRWPRYDRQDRLCRR
jgi:endonuclease YncB( thermonuclease family)